MRRFFVSVVSSWLSTVHCTVGLQATCSVISAVRENALATVLCWAQRHQHEPNAAAHRSGPCVAPPGGLEIDASRGAGLLALALGAPSRGLQHSAVAGWLGWQSVPGHGFTAGWPPQRQGCDGQGQQQQHLVSNSA